MHPRRWQRLGEPGSVDPGPPEVLELRIRGRAGAGAGAGGHDAYRGWLCAIVVGMGTTTTSFDGPLRRLHRVLALRHALPADRWSLHRLLEGALRR